MANNRYLAIAALCAGVILGAGALKFAESSADLVAVRSDLYRNQRSINEAKELGIEDEGHTGVQWEWHSAATRTQVRGSSPKQAVSGCTRIRDAADRADCLQKLVEDIVNFQQ